MELISINALWINDWIFLGFAPQDTNIPFDVDSWAQKVTNYSALMVWGLMKSPKKVCLSLPTADITNQLEPSFPWTKYFRPYSLSHWESEWSYRILIRDQHCGSRERKQDQTEVEIACVTGLIKPQGSCKLWSIDPTDQRCFIFSQNGWTFISLPQLTMPWPGHDLCWSDSLQLRQTLQQLDAGSCPLIALPAAGSRSSFLEEWSEWCISCLPHPAVTLGFFVWYSK